MTQVKTFALALPDMRKKSALLAFLVNHDRHNEANFGADFRFSNDVKLWNLNLGAWDGDLCMKARAVLDYQQESGDMLVYTALFENWESAQGDISVGFGGRSGGHIVLYGETAANLSPDDLAGLDMAELRRLVKLVCAFDSLCDDCVAAFMELVTDYQIVSEDVTVTNTVTVQSLVSNDDISESERAIRERQNAIETSEDNPPAPAPVMTDADGAPLTILDGVREGNQLHAIVRYADGREDILPLYQLRGDNQPGSLAFMTSELRRIGAVIL